MSARWVQDKLDGVPSKIWVWRSSSVCLSKATHSHSHGHYQRRRRQIPVPALRRAWTEALHVLDLPCGRKCSSTCANSNIARMECKVELGCAHIFVVTGATVCCRWALTTPRHTAVDWLYGTGLCVDLLWWGAAARRLRQPSAIHSRAEARCLCRRWAMQRYMFNLEPADGHGGGLIE